MWLRRQGLFVFIFLIASNSAHAGLLGEENISLAKMVTQLEAMYTKMVETVEEAKAQNDTLSKMNDVIKEAKEEVDVVQNSFLHNIDDVFSRDLDNVTGLDNLSGMSLEDKLIALSRELDRRLREPLSEAERNNLEAQKRLVMQEEFLLKLESASQENIGKAADGVTEKEAAQIAAESAAIYAAMAAAERNRQVANDRERVEDDTQHDRIMNMQSGIFGAAAERER